MAKYYVICDDDCRYEGMTREQILAAIEQALEQGFVSEPDEAVFSRIKELRANEAIQLWVGAEDEFNALSLPVEVGRAFVRVGANGILYLCHDDRTADAFEGHMGNTNNPHNVTLAQVLNGESLGTIYKEGVVETHDKWIDGKQIYAVTYTGTYKTKNTQLKLIMPPGIVSMLGVIGFVGNYPLGQCNSGATDSIRFYAKSSGDYFILDSFTTGDYNIVVYFTSAIGDASSKEESESGLDGVVLA